METKASTRLDDQARHFMNELMGPRTAEALMEMPSSVIDEVIRKEMLRRARRERSRPRNILIIGSDVWHQS
jgi:hypothetical protein